MVWLVLVTIIEEELREYKELLAEVLVRKVDLKEEKKMKSKSSNVSSASASLIALLFLVYPFLPVLFSFPFSSCASRLSSYRGVNDAETVCPNRVADVLNVDRVQRLTIRRSVPNKVTQNDQG